MKTKNKTSILDEYLYIRMSDESVWKIPVRVIAENRAKYYAEEEFGGDLQKSLKKDTVPLFEESEYDIYDWASNNMDWEEVKDSAIRIEDPIPADYNTEWSDAEKWIEE